MKDMPNLDLVRGIAVLLVVVCHALMVMGWETFSPFGYTLDLGFISTLGVVIFFVHTCLVLMWSLERNPDPLSFYIRRIFRIYPLSMLVVLLIVLFHIPVSIAGKLHFDHLTSAWQLPANLLLIQNIVRVPNVMGPLWTLPLEIQMYLLLPFLFFFVRSNKVLWPLVTLWIAIAALNHYQNYGPNYLVTAIPFFLPGVMAYVAFQKVRPTLPGWLLPLAMAVLILLATHTPKLPAMYAYALALGLMLPFFRQIQAPWLKHSAFTIAKYSYGIYLTHALAIMVGIDKLPNHSHWLQAAVILGFIVITVIPAYYLIEAPMIRLGHKLSTHIARNHRAQSKLEC